MYAQMNEQNEKKILLELALSQKCRKRIVILVFWPAPDYECVCVCVLCIVCNVSGRCFHQFQRCA